MNAGPAVSPGIAPEFSLAGVHAEVRKWVLEIAPTAREDEVVPELWRGEFAAGHRRAAEDSRLVAELAQAVHTTPQAASNGFLARAASLEQHPRELDLYFDIGGATDTGARLTQGALAAHLERAFPAQEVVSDVMGIRLHDPRSNSNFVLINFTPPGSSGEFLNVTVFR